MLSLLLGVCELGVSKSFVFKKSYKKNRHNFELYQVFMHNFFVPKCPNIPIIHTVYKKNEHILV